ncbi:Krueppel homolog 1 [Gryllus bimaculatus]|nr:Krueppel homolog 1 [Gryllus bimaculatus]
MLFNEESETHPIVILTDTLFHTLKTVIEFVYCGKAEIPANQFDAFLELAVSLQIKGLNNSFKKDRKTGIDNSVDENSLQYPSSVTQDTFEIRSTRTSQEDSSSITSAKHFFHLSCGSKDTMQTDSSVPVKGCSDACKMVQSRAVVMSQPDYESCAMRNDLNVSINTEINVKCEPLCSEYEDLETKNAVSVHQSSPVQKNPEMLINTEISVKREPLHSEIELLVTKNKILGDVNQEDPMSANIGSELNDKSSPPFDRDLNQYSCGRGSVHEVGNSALGIPLQQRQHVSHLPCELPPPELAEECDSLPPQHLVPKCEKTDIQSEESMGAQDLAGDEADKMDEEIEYPFEQKFNPDSNGEYILPDEELSPQRRNGRWQRTMEEQEPAPEETLTLSGRHNSRRTGERPYARDECKEALAQPAHRPTHGHTDTEESLYHCDMCGKAFNHSSSLIGHMRSHSGKRLYKCDACGKTYIHPTHLSRHKRIHTGEPTFSCDMCGKGFTESSKLTIHKRFHTGERRYQCDVCGKAFFTSTDLTIHKRTHTGERPYSCVLCEKTFTQLNALDSHKRSHTGERPYPCSVCAKAFSSSSKLARHKRIHSKERPYQCDMCEKAFIFSGQLVRHKRLHTGERPYSCDVCEKAFTASGDLTRHRRTHSGERPFSCDFCEKTFTQKSNLAVHKRSHKGERSYPCDVCKKSFILATHLARHKRTHMGERP